MKIYISQPQNSKKEQEAIDFLLKQTGYQAITWCSLTKKDGFLKTLNVFPNAIHVIDGLIWAALLKNEYYIMPYMQKILKRQYPEPINGLYNPSNDIIKRKHWRLE